MNLTLKVFDQKYLPIPWPKNVILGLVFIVYVGCTYDKNEIDFGSPGTLLLDLKYNDFFEEYVPFSAEFVQ